jgi:elongation factor P
LISTNEFRTGVTIEVDGEIYTVIEFQHVKPGKGAAFVRSKLKNIKTGGVQEKTFRAGEKVARAHIDRREMQYLYNSGDQYTLMDMETYDQMNLSEDQLGDAVKYLKENMELIVHLYQGIPVGVDLPNSVVLEVIETDPGFRGDTATGGSKPAKLETGVVVQVPFFINVGDALKIDTRTGQYIERA